ncbi:hypothetical protein [Aureibacillus halotolerans]|uniref:Uncharacterized protein n=1 Tax=Aureibacillus halotolerans TaxID=1508390 RepID=A0A4R6UIH5_9BACI|nr:hypothetical protein [Aureibacillus halotolerans]TDQ42974.1 hypothetical protein EV213_101406 [Aureibacillus halotolerans]
MRRVIYILILVPFIISCGKETANYKLSVAEQREKVESKSPALYLKDSTPFNLNLSAKLTPDQNQVEFSIVLEDIEIIMEDVVMAGYFTETGLDFFMEEIYFLNLTNIPAVNSGMRGTYGPGKKRGLINSRDFTLKRSTPLNKDHFLEVLKDIRILVIWKDDSQTVNERIFVLPPSQIHIGDKIIK